LGLPNGKSDGDEFFFNATNPTHPLPISRTAPGIGTLATSPLRTTHAGWLNFHGITMFSAVSNSDGS
jgi:hypothetical protein